MKLLQTKEYRFIDKSGWERGAWDSEPDKIQWQDRSTGLPCLAVRQPSMGNWCGYVGVARLHPYFERAYDDEIVALRCHGGLTYSAHCQKGDPEHGVCHIPAPGEPDDVWWFGFDCAHGGDYGPGLAATLKSVGGSPGPADVYRDLAYVRRECAQLARQLAAVSLNND
jgi:hypothetical protein